MGKKYIIEIEDGKEGIILCQKGIVTVGLRLENESELKPLGIQSAIPYTEPDLEQVRLEAEQLGMVLAWDAVKKILYMPEGDLLELFDVYTPVQVMLAYTAAEAIEKMKAYEQEQEEIKVGDEVGYYGVADEHGNVNYSGVVIEIRKDDYLVLEKDGKTYALKKNLVMSKTGRHFPDIAAVLKRMRGEQDE